MGLADEITKLAELHRQGAISDGEYASAKAKVIDGSSPPSAVSEIAPTIEFTRPNWEKVEPPNTSKQNISIEWMKSWGWFLTFVGLIGFFGSAYTNWRSGHESEALLCAVLNPLFFISMPIGVYWMCRSGELSKAGRIFERFLEDFYIFALGLLTFIGVGFLVYLLAQKLF